MMNRELRLQYLMLEDSYRNLEKRVAELETEMKLKNLLGVKEKLENTSISLFLLRKDRERLSEELGLDMEDYDSVKSFGEEALEHLVYECKDVIDGLQEGMRESLKAEFSPVILDVSKREETSGVSLGLSGLGTGEGIKEPAVVKEIVKKRTRRTKAEMQALREEKERLAKGKAEEKESVVVESGLSSESLESSVSSETVSAVSSVGSEPVSAVTAKAESTKVETAASNSNPVSIESASAVTAKTESVAETQSKATVEVKNAANSDISHLNQQEVATTEFKDMDAVLSMWG